MRYSKKIIAKILADGSARVEEISMFYGKDQRGGCFLGGERLVGAPEQIHVMGNFNYAAAPFGKGGDKALCSRV